MTTHGTYKWRIGARGPEWVLTLDPSTRMRARRLFGKVQLTRSMEIVISDTDEVCRDISWFSERYPLEAAPQSTLEGGRPAIDSEQRLRDGAKRHEQVELEVAAIIGGTAERLDLPIEPKKTPREYQLTAVQLLRARRHLLLTDEVGLGKTFTGLLGLVHPDARPALIVPPTHLPPRWETELQEAFPTLTYAIAKTTEPRSQLKFGLPDVLIVPYSKLDGWAGHLAGKMRTVVFDEVQELRNGVFTNKGAAAALVTADADYVLGLTATPVYNYGGEIFNVLDILAPGHLGTREEFAREWGGASVGGKLTVADPHALGSHLRESGLMLGRSRKQVGRELPKTIKVPTMVDSGHEALDEVKLAAQALAERILSSTSTNQQKWQAAGEIDMQMRHATGVDKAPFVADYVRMLLESEERIIIWGWHRDVYEIWLERLADFNPVMYTGSESPTQKRKAEVAFTTPYVDGDEKQARVLLMSLRSGAGVDGLQKVCRVGVFGELDWSPQVHEQAIGRLRRDGMGDDPPVAFFLYSAEGSDPVLMDVLQLKRQQSEPMLTDDGKLFANATTDTNRGRRLAEQILGRTSTTAAPDEEISA